MSVSEAGLLRKLWEHPDPKSTQMWKFKEDLARETGERFPDHDSLYQWSIRNRARFWAFCFDYFPIIHEGKYTAVVDESARIDSIPDWFPGVRLNYAENILFTAGASGSTTTAGKEDGKIAFTEVREGAAEPVVNLSWGALRRRTGRMLQALKAAGVRKGDRVSVVAGNAINTAVVLFAVTALGGIFSSTSTDTGVGGILDRVRQVQPKWVFFDDFAVYNGKTIDLRPKIAEVVNGLLDISEFQGVVLMPRFAGRPADISPVPRSQSLATFLEGATSDKLEFVRVGFRDPFLIVFTSGTTGQPKCIVHAVGGAVLNSMKENKLNRNHTPDTVLLQYTTTGWIMYMAAVGCLQSGARSVLYDGSPFVPDLEILLRILEEQKVTNFGTSPRFFNELRKNRISPRQIADLSNLSLVTSTGMVLSESLFEWFYDEGFPPTTQLANIAGGTDLITCFGMENPLDPLYAGGCQGTSLGLPMAIFEQADEGATGVQGRPVQPGVPGEVVVTDAFPTMPVMFWGEDGPKKYFNAYFARFDNAWTHGDFVSVHPVTKQVLFHGRSDGVLNPSGVRFGSAEIYNVIETQFADEIQDSVCVGQRRPTDPDESVILFLLMKEGSKFTPQLVARVKEAIRKARTARHVPKYIFETPEIPTTVNLKKVELPVKQIVSGVKVKPSGTLLNPQSLDFYYQFVEVEKLLALKSKL
ncbi:hypothetical protein ASPZODRAFT_152419 [Penicilliopsis zonata CBS 506.65]|uniref:AMP-dependent synthetase/ligase domain-containing protein n=1 Tax=Penicilliopsis zonata CBS 506.65 TaxID=1073090 RepID=A0A1L9SGC5_9EURO|nr:hypothetical protein ASPZODRAFT_152419 [Penicilliopsis zonata CBS 506.65]OJJ46221.1 hypothetical protein ASPZODRAFT_152419 [Penicilliopsis zonata CBS 506.65]